MHNKCVTYSKLKNESGTSGDTVIL